MTPRDVRAELLWKYASSVRETKRMTFQAPTDPYPTQWVKVVWERVGAGRATMIRDCRE